MKFKIALATTLTAIILTGCSSPQRIILKDNTVIETKDEANYNKKTGFYEYKDASGNTSHVNADSIVKIEEVK